MSGQLEYQFFGNGVEETSEMRFFYVVVRGTNPGDLDISGNFRDIINNNTSKNRKIGGCYARL